MAMDLTPDLVHRVRSEVSRHVRRTPLLPSDRLSRATGSRIHLKCENLQVTGSFKVRGAVAAVSLLSDRERRHGVVTASAGNHGLGLAFAARAYGLRCRVVIPAGAPRVKEDGIRALGAEVLRSPHEGYDETAVWALDHTEGARFVSPFEDPAVMAGNGGTLFAEIEEDLPDLDAVVVPCGGGGLINGIGILARSRESGPTVIGVNTDASPGMWLSFRDGRPHLRVDSAPTIAEGIEGGVGELTFRLARRLVERIVLVPETSLGPALADLALQEHMVVEGSAAAGVAAVLEGCLPPGSRVCVVLTGSNIDPDRLRTLLALSSPPTKKAGPPGEPA